MALHELSAAIEPEEWYTPAHVFHALGLTFNLDVAHPPRCDLPVDRWLTPGATSGSTRFAYYTKAQDGLQQSWFNGRVWMNPPFGARNQIVPWLRRFMEHRNGVAFVPDRTSAPWWQTYAPQADALLFISPKVKMLSPIGLEPVNSPGQGTTLMACGAESVAALKRAEKAGLGKVWIRPGDLA